jgi:hypothetical protein
MQILMETLFQYTVTDLPATSTGSQNIKVNPINDAPVAEDDNYTVNE